VQHVARNLDGAGEDEHILALIASEDNAPSFAIADRVLVIAREPSTRRWHVVHTDSTHWTSGLIFRDVTGDGLPDLLLQRHGGGNDPVATEGLAVVSAHGGPLRSVLSLRHGAPRVVTVDRGAVGIEVYGRLWPPLVPRAQSTEFLDDILVFDNGLFRTDRKVGHVRFLAMARDAVRDYEAMRVQCLGDTVQFKDSAESNSDLLAYASPLFTPAARVLLYARRHGAYRMAERFWSNEREFLGRRLATEQYRALDSMSTRLVLGFQAHTEALQ